MVVSDAPKGLTKAIRESLVGVHGSDVEFTLCTIIRLVTGHLIEYNKDWPAGKAYIHPEKIVRIQEKRQMAV